MTDEIKLVIVICILFLSTSIFNFPPVNQSNVVLGYLIMAAFKILRKRTSTGTSIGTFCTFSIPFCQSPMLLVLFIIKAA